MLYWNAGKSSAAMRPMVTSMNSGNCVNASSYERGFQHNDCLEAGRMKKDAIGQSDGSKKRDLIYGS